jgi:hypothetical protein
MGSPTSSPLPSTGPVAWDVPFAAAQLLIGLGLLVPRTARLALAASVPWSLGVWFFGEGLSGLAGGHASLLTGAPASALLYGVLALAAWPQRDRPDEAPARWLRLAWAVLWIGGAVFQALPGQNTGTAIGAPRRGRRRRAVLAPPARSVHRRLDKPPRASGRRRAGRRRGVDRARRAPPQEPCTRRGGRPRARTGDLVVGQDLVQLYTGQATDPNTARLIAQMAVALLGTSRDVGVAVVRAPVPEKFEAGGFGAEPLRDRGAEARAGSARR